MDVAYLLRRAAQEHRDARAVVSGDAERSFSELHQRAHRLAHALRAHGIRPGDRVAILLNNCVEFVEVDLALAVGGMVRVALNARLGPEDVRYCVEDCGAKAVITASGFDHVVEDLVQDAGLLWVRLSEDPTSAGPGVAYESLFRNGASGEVDHAIDVAAPAWISYTSGTTGKPKGVVLSQRTLIQVAFNFMLEFDRSTMARSILLTQPLSHGAGYFVLPYLIAGGTLHVVAKFDAEEVLQISRKNRIAVLKVVPAMIFDLLDLPDAPQFETILYGASPIPRQQVERALDRFGPVLAQLYGQSEAPMTLTFLSREDHVGDPVLLESAGRAWRNVGLRIVDGDGTALPAGELGELAVEAPHVMDGYYGRPDLTAEVLKDGWLLTKDMAYMDDRGYVFLRGRRDEMIISGGYNIAPKEIEDVLSEHSAVSECVVVAAAHDRWGQVPKAFIKVPDGGNLEPETLLTFCRQRLGFRRPRFIALVDHIPRTAYGKVDRAALAALPAVEIPLQ